MAEYTTELATLDDKAEIYGLLEDAFFNDMPLFKALSIRTPPTIDTWPALQTLADNLTLKAVLPSGKIIGAAINVVPKDGVAVDVPTQLSRFFGFLDNDSKGLLTKLEKTELELRVMVVDREWRGKKVSKKLVEESEKLARSIGRNGIFGMATGVFMEGAFRSNAWNCVYRFHYKDYMNIDQSFEVPSHPHTSLTLYHKIFNL